jgi:hypothetical protein
MRAVVGSHEATGGEGSPDEVFNFARREAFAIVGVAEERSL